MLQGISIGGYRSFGENVQRIFPLKKVNIFAGPNNCGKSNVLRFIRDCLLPFLRDRKRRVVENGDKHIGKACATTIGIAVEATASSFQPICDQYPGLASWLRECLASLTHDHGFIFFEGITRDDSGSASLRLPSVAANPTNPKQALRAWREAYHALTKSSEADMHRCAEVTLSRLLPIHFDRPSYAIPTDRRVGVNLLDDKKTSRTLIQDLQSLQNPKHNEQENRQRFQALNDFLAATTDQKDARLEIPYTADAINVHMNQRVLPLPSLGTGIEQVILLAAACTLRKDAIICLEEPELNLHPILQRKLLRYLSERTTNQYFIATHSAAILDTPDASIFRVSLAADHTTVVNFVDSDAIRWNICRDLGYRASDIVQANCVIWVEGPSDRVYLKHWIESLDSSLIEGIHYAIFFYGGRLLSHLSAEDTEVTDFIKLKCLNRNIAILIDSDKKNKNDQLNATKTRIITEFRGDNSIAWVTAGREVENYVPSQTMLEAVAAEFPGRESKVKNTPFARVLPTVTDEKNSAIVDKIRVARAVVQKKPSINILDLQDRLKELIEFIRKANT